MRQLVQRRHKRQASDIARPSCLHYPPPLVALVCHAPGVLRHVKTADGRPLVEGKKVTGFTNSEEAGVGLADVVPFLVEDELKAKGGIYSKGPDWETHIVQDGLLASMSPIGADPPRYRCASYKLHPPSGATLLHNVDYSNAASAPGASPLAANCRITSRKPLRLPNATHPY